MFSLCPCSSSKLHYFVLSSGILECNWQGKSRARSQERIDFSAQTSRCTCVLCTVSWQPQPTDVRRFTVTAFCKQWYTGSKGRRRHPHQISHCCHEFFGDTPHSHCDAHTQTHTVSEVHTLQHTVNMDQLALTHKETTKNKTYTWQDRNKQCRTGIKTQHHLRS